MVLSEREKTAIMVSQVITLYSMRMQEEKIPQHQSVVDFISKNMPSEFRSQLSMDLIDDVFSLMSEHRLELS